MEDSTPKLAQERVSYIYLWDPIKGRGIAH